MRHLLIAFVLAAAVGACQPAGDDASKLALPFIVDNFDAALAQAQEQNLPLFVETWAPW